EHGFVAVHKRKTVRIWEEDGPRYEAQLQVAGFESGNLKDSELASLVEDLSAHTGKQFSAKGARTVKEPKRSVARVIYELVRS
ncbi:MAG TPA: hypothetical protein VH208_02060, partial [Myxococcaceae bacterium]|nr:hypothetical protein [Myxococcaceae bacterium]